MDCRGSCLLFVFVLHLLINVGCSLLPFGNGGMGLSMQSPPGTEEPKVRTNPMGGTTPCLLNCKIQPNPCGSNSNTKGCPPPNNIPPQHGFNIPPQHGFSNQPMNPFSFPTPPPPTTTKTTTTTTTKAMTTTIHEKDVAEKHHYIFTTTTSPSPQSTTTATSDITVNPPAHWMIFNKK
ncbi:uncharacterized protein [Magallana gigas]|uniref:uncharacterized protein n=1 Tax=Magallana gigas TaxID=29159 RepID=UPI003342D1EB